MSKTKAEYIKDTAKVQVTVPLSELAAKVAEILARRGRGRGGRIGVGGSAV